jgi:hypothetical protein
MDMEVDEDVTLTNPTLAAAPVSAAGEAPKAAARPKLSLREALAAASPRINPRKGTWQSAVIHGSVTALWLLLFARAFFLHGALAWSTGIAYVVYDTLLLAFVTVKTLPLIRRSLPAHRFADTANLPSMGVIVAAHNEAGVLPVTLAALLRQTHGPAQIVIADDGSTDGTRDLLTRRFGLVEPAMGELSAPSSRHPNLYWLRVPHGGKALALNAAIEVMTTATVMTVDADTLLADDATLAMRAAFAQSPKLVAATGILVPVCNRTASGRVFQWFQTYEYMSNFIARFAWMRADSLLLVSGASTRNVSSKITSWSTGCGAIPSITNWAGKSAWSAMRMRRRKRPQRSALSCASAAAGSRASCRRSTGIAT